MKGISVLKIKYGEIKMPYSIETFETNSGKYVFWRKTTRELIENIKRFAKDEKVRKAIDEMLDYSENFLTGKKLEFSKLERARMLSYFQNGEIALRYSDVENLRLLQIVSHIKNEDVHSILETAADFPYELTLPNLEQIACQSTSGMAMSKFADILLNAEKEFSDAYENCDSYSKKELLKIYEPRDRDILLARAIAVSSQLKIDAWNIRKAFLPYGHGRYNIGYFEGQDLGNHNEIYLNDEQHQKILKRVKPTPFEYKR